MNEKNIIERIKNKIHSIEPTATIVLYGSYARGDFSKDSDIDILILIDKPEISSDDERKITYPLYDIEFETGKIISPLVYSKWEWENRRKVTPFYENVKKDGVLI